MGDPLVHPRRDARDRRALVVAELLRMGWSPQSIGECVKIADAGGSVVDAMAALRKPSLRASPAAPPKQEDGPASGALDERAGARREADQP